MTTAETHIRSFDSTLQTTHRWLQELELPMLIRGFYYEGWKPSTTPKKQRSVQAFLEGVQLLPKLKGELNAEQALPSVFLMRALRISEVEIADMRQTMPERVRELWPKH